jgi:hypothetical protein
MQCEEFAKHNVQGKNDCYSLLVPTATTSPLTCSRSQLGPLRCQQHVTIKHLRKQTRSQILPNLQENIKENIKITNSTIQLISIMQGFTSVIITAMVALVVNVSRCGLFQYFPSVRTQPRLHSWKDPWLSVAHCEYRRGILAPRKPWICCCPKIFCPLCSIIRLCFDSVLACKANKS